MSLEGVVEENGLSESVAALFPPDQLRAQSDRTRRREMLLSNLANLEDDLRRGAEESDSEQSMSDRAADALRAAGIFGVLVPDDLGGNEVDPLTAYELVLSLSQVDMSTSWTAAILFQGAGEMATLLRPELASTVFFERVATKVTSLAVGEAERAEHGWYLSGRWNFLSGLRQADYAALAFLDPSAREGEERRSALIPRESLTVLDDWDVLGMRGTGSTSVTARRVFVSDDFVHDRFDVGGYARQDTPLARLGPTPYVLQANAAQPLGASRRALDEIIAAAPRIRRGSRINARELPSLAQSSWFVRELGELDARWQAADRLARATLDRITATLDASPSARLTLADTDAMQIACSFAAKTSADIITRVLRNFGSSAIRTGNVIERALRDVNTLCAHGGLGEAGFESHGEFILGLQDEATRRLV